MCNYSKIKRRTYEIIEKDDASDKVSHLFDLLILILIVTNTVAIVLESFKMLNIMYSAQFRIFEIFSVIVFSIEYILRIWTSDIGYPSKKGKLGSVFKYMFSMMAIIDLLAIIPFYLPMFFPVDLRFLRMFRISRLLRIFKINRYTKALSLIADVIKDKKDELLATVFVMGFVILITSTMMYYFETEVQPEAFPNIVASFWWSLSTLTPIGYVDFYPITNMGKIFAGVISILGIGLVALPTGIISSGFIAALNRQEKIDSRMVCPHCGEDIEPKTGNHKEIGTTKGASETRIDS